MQRHSNPLGFLNLPPKQGTGTGATSAPPTIGGSGYLPIHMLDHSALRPHQLGVGTPIPNNNLGAIGQRPFSKTQGGTPAAKIIIKTQLQTQ